MHDVVVTTADGRWRLTLLRDRPRQWIVQKRKSPRLDIWRHVYFFHTRAGLQFYRDSALQRGTPHPEFPTDQFFQDPAVSAAIDALPDRLDDSISV
jgi:hypothetical protein